MGAKNTFILALLEFALNHNLQVMEASYQQMRGTSMGSLRAPSYTYLHLDWREKEEVVFWSLMYLIHVALWYTANILELWKGSESDFHVFLNELGNNDHNIWLTYNFEKVTPSLSSLSLLRIIDYPQEFTIRRQL